MWQLKEFLLFVAMIVADLHTVQSFHPTRFASSKTHTRIIGRWPCQIIRIAESDALGINRHSPLITRLSERTSSESDGDDSSNAKLKEEQNAGGNSWIDSRQIDEYGLIVGDVLAIVLASQLMGLLDVLNDPEFVRQGGWLQPVLAVPSTLGTLLERISTLSLVWLLAAFFEEESYTFTAIENEKSSILVALKIAFNFVALRCIFAVVLAVAAGGGNSLEVDIFENVPLGLLLRDCYFVALGLPAFRFIYTKYWVQ